MTAQPETKISGNRVFNGKLVKLDVDRVRLRDGSSGTREVVRHPGASVVLPLLDDGRMIMIRQFRYPTLEVLLELPAGTLEENEDPLVCAGRELIEETGWQARELHRLGSIFTTPGFTDELIHCFVAEGLSPAAGGTAHEPDEAIDVVIMSCDEVHELARTGQLQDAKTLATVFLARLHQMI
jgi:ADP-ribose pyrophosphatase